MCVPLRATAADISTYVPVHKHGRRFTSGNRKPRTMNHMSAVTRAMHKAVLIASVTHRVQLQRKAQE